MDDPVSLDTALLAAAAQITYGVRASEQEDVPYIVRVTDQFCEIDTSPCQ